MGQFVLSAHTIFDHLALASGDVDDAVNSLQRAHAVAITQPLSTTGIPIQYFLTAEQERRAAADVIPLFANRGRDPAKQIVLSRVEAALLLELANGDMDHVVTMLNDYEGTMTKLHIRYDGLRELTGTETERQEQADVMLAHLIHITDRPDWWSVGIHLKMHKWNFVKAVAAWQRYGIIPVKHNKDRAGTRMEGHGRRKAVTATGLVVLPMPTLAECTQYTPRQDITWGPTPHQFVASTDINRPEPTVVMQSEELRKGRPFSSIIHHHSATAKIDCPDQTKMIVEYIVEGRYKMNVYDSANFRWPAFPKPNDAAKPIFDFTNQTHVEALNKMYTQSYLRITGMNRRPGGEDWSKQEKSYLYDLCGILYGQQSLAKDEAEVELRLPMQTLEAWVVDFKTRFGTERTPHALSSMARRNQELCEDFGLTWYGV